MPELATLLLWGLAIVLVMTGLAGTILPMLPGVPFVFGGLLIGAWIDNFQRIGWGTLTILAVLTAMAIAVDFLASVIGAQRAGASKQALAGAAIGSVVGIFFWLWGNFIFPLFGAGVRGIIAHPEAGATGPGRIATLACMAVCAP